jgi:hypothetical protein
MAIYHSGRSRTGGSAYLEEGWHIGCRCVPCATEPFLTFRSPGGEWAFAVNSSAWPERRAIMHDCCDDFDFGQDSAVSQLRSWVRRGKKSQDQMPMTWARIERAGSACFDGFCTLDADAHHTQPSFSLHFSIWIKCCCQ